jgi:hypothetical protein
MGYFVDTRTCCAGTFPRGDHRDWQAIRGWAESLKALLEV